MGIKTDDNENFEKLIEDWKQKVQEFNQLPKRSQIGHCTTESDLQFLRNEFQDFNSRFDDSYARWVQKAEDASAEGLEDAGDVFKTANKALQGVKGHLKNQAVIKQNATQIIKQCDYCQN